MIGLPGVISAARSCFKTQGDFAASRDGVKQNPYCNILWTNFLSGEALTYAPLFLGYRIISTFINNIDLLGSLHILSNPWGLAAPVTALFSAVYAYKAISNVKRFGLSDEGQYNKSAITLGALSLGLSIAAMWLGENTTIANWQTMMGIPLSSLLLLSDTHATTHAIGYHRSQIGTLVPPENQPRLDRYIKWRYNRSTSQPTINVKPCMSWKEGGEAFAVMPFVSGDRNTGKFLMQIGSYTYKNLFGRFLGNPTSQEDILKAEAEVKNINARLRDCKSVLSPTGEFRTLATSTEEERTQEFLQGKYRTFGEMLKELGRRYKEEYAPPIQPQDIGKVMDEFKVSEKDLRQFFEISADGKSIKPKTDIENLVENDKSLTEKEKLKIMAVCQRCLGDKHVRDIRDIWTSKGIEMIADGEKFLEKANGADTLTADDLINEWEYYLDLYSVEVEVGASRNERWGNFLISKAASQDSWRAFYGLSAYEV
ncbi:MAG: hypothetical protein AABZ57_04190, partial [Candidatus Margulisiibacteriota bacterium]